MFAHSLCAIFVLGVKGDDNILRWLAVPGHLFLYVPQGGEIVELHL